MKSQHSKILKFAIAVLIAFAISSQTYAKFGDDEFEEDDSKQEETMDWPEVVFPTTEERGAGFHVGERFEYRAQWGIFRKAGKIIIETRGSLDGENEKFHVDTTTASAGLIRSLYPMTLQANSILDPKHWRMERNEVDGKTRSKLNQSLTVIDYESMIQNFDNKAEPAKNKIRELPYEYPLDYSSAFLQLRGYNLKKGGLYPIFVSTKGKFYYIEMIVAEVEDQKSILGTTECFRLEAARAYPESKVFREGGKMAIWITTDEKRIPIRFDVKTSVGTASVRLENYEYSPSANDLKVAKSESEL